MTEKILLLHGLWLHPWAMRWLKQQFTNAGYEVVTPIYHSISSNSAHNVSLVYQAVQRYALPTERLHIVAHSLGGIVALQMLTCHAELPPGRLVTLGTPAKGSLIAHRLAKYRWFRPLIGLSFEGGLDGQGLPETLLQHEWGALAGTNPIGVGRIFGGIAEVNDGVVALSETYHPAQTAHRILPVSHSSMLFSKQVAQECLHFIRTGQFSPQH
ncbi:alpha/beta hydrolase [uncultured Thiothrix sp.]|uniref:esterase/lipase family protein n=1 Tax=uncultured Thiothrix sp. TaxID=223185 RepID=UPI00261F3CDB|nr:alpha/beta hydrolase [uncultured Thiothrix sp.]